MKFRQIDPHSLPPNVVIVPRRKAVRDQLESAIWLWFHKAAGVSIHTLVMAARGVIDAIDRETGHKSPVTAWLESQSVEAQKRVSAAHNFFKHGRLDNRKKLQPGSEEVVAFPPEFSEMLLMDALASYQRLFNDVTPIMNAFTLRFRVMHPEALLKSPNDAPLQDSEVENLSKLDRTEFLNRVLPLFLT